MLSFFRRRAVPVRCCTENELKRARAVLRARRGDTELWDALSVLLDARALDAMSAANGPAVPDAEAKWFMGGAAAMLAAKAEIDGLTRPESKGVTR